MPAPLVNSYHCSNAWPLFQFPEPTVKLSNLGSSVDIRSSIACQRSAFLTRNYGPSFFIQMGARPGNKACACSSLKPRAVTTVQSSKINCSREDECAAIQSICQSNAIVKLPNASDLSCRNGGISRKSTNSHTPQ